MKFKTGRENYNLITAECEVGVLAPEEFRWKSFLGEDLEPLVVLVCHFHGKLFVILCFTRLGNRRPSLCCLETQNAP